MVPLLGIGVIITFRVLDVNVPIYHIRYAGLSPPGHAAWVTSEGIKWDWVHESKVRARHGTRNEQGYTGHVTDTHASRVREQEVSGQKPYHDRNRPGPYGCSLGVCGSSPVTCARLSAVPIRYVLRCPGRVGF